MHRLHVMLHHFIEGTWANEHFGICDDPGTSPLQIPRDGCYQRILVFPHVTVKMKIIVVIVRSDTEKCDSVGEHSVSCLANEWA